MEIVVGDLITVEGVQYITLEKEFLDEDASEVLEEEFMD